MLIQLDNIFLYNVSYKNRLIKMKIQNYETRTTRQFQVNLERKSMYGVANYELRV